MTSSWRSARWAITVLTLGFGCKGDPATRDCGDQEPTFLLTVRAATGEALPENTTVEVTYGGDITESYSLAEPSASHEVLFCTPQGRSPGGEAGAGGQGGARPGAEGPAALVCTLWIEGGASVEVNGGDWGASELSLSPDSDDCGPLTVEEEVVLGSEPEQD